MKKIYNILGPRLYSINNIIDLLIAEKLSFVTLKNFKSMSSKE